MSVASSASGSLPPSHRAIADDSNASGVTSQPRRSPSGNRVNSLRHAVVVPLPGMLLTRELFQAARLGDAFNGHASAVDAELGEDAILSASSVREAAESVIAGLERRHNGAMGLLVGHSYGGYVALEVARRAPQWLAGLVLMSTQSPADTKGAAARRQKQIDLARSSGIPTVINGLLPALLSPKAQEDEAIVGMVMRMAEQTGLANFERQMQACIMRPDQRNTLQDLDPRIPVLVISGVKDKLIPPRCARELASELKAREASAPAASSVSDMDPEKSGAPRRAPWAVRTHPESGHLLSLEQPEALHNYLASWANEVHSLSAG